MFPEWLAARVAVRAGIYARISSDREGTGWAWRGRSRIASGWRSGKGWQIVERYVDDDVSAWSGKQRPEYERLPGRLSSSGVIDGGAGL